ncbi:MAG TPA: right-handed parallel beta-helix repeat-containing protein [Vicinamibacteria bacterium]
MTDPMARPGALALCLLALSCGSSGANPTAPQSPGAGGGGGSGTAGAIGEWTDAPGACPSGVPRVDLASVSEIENASRGSGGFARDAPATCYFIRNGTYRQGSSLLLFVQRGGGAGGRRTFVGESRTGVVLVGRASIDDDVSNVTISNLTLTLNGYSQSGSFSTITVGEASGIVLDHLNLTGDCNTGARGAHVEANGVSGLLVEASLLEAFGRCRGGGHEDHGIYLASGRDITIRNNVIRGNSSRGIQLYTGEGDYGTLSQITIENNRIVGNGHANFEDGIVVNGRDSGTIDNLTVRRNLIYGNFFAGIRFAGPATRNVRVENNTFYRNGAGSTSSARAEVCVDDEGMAAGAILERNIFSVARAVINDCYDGAARGFQLRDNIVNGAVSSGASNCVSASVLADPQFTDPERGDFRTRNSAAAGYGAYAP